MAVIVTILFVPVGLVLWARWYWTLLAAPRLARPYHRRWLLLITPILCCVGIAATEALHESVIATANNMYLYAAIYEFGLLGVVQVTFPFFGISPLVGWFCTR